MKAQQQLERIHHSLFRFHTLREKNRAEELLLETLLSLLKAGSFCDSVLDLFFAIYLFL